METADFLSTVPLLSGLDPSELAKFAEVTRERSYPKGSVILFEHDPGDSLFIVRSGRVKVVLIGEDGREVILGILGVSNHFGELSLIDSRPRRGMFGLQVAFVHPESVHGVLSEVVSSG